MSNLYFSNNGSATQLVRKFVLWLVRAILGARRVLFTRTPAAGPFTVEREI